MAQTSLLHSLELISVFKLKIFVVSRPIAQAKSVYVSISVSGGTGGILNAGSACTEEGCANAGDAIDCEGADNVEAVGNCTALADSGGRVNARDAANAVEVGRNLADASKERFDGGGTGDDEGRFDAADAGNTKEPFDARGCINAGEPDNGIGTGNSKVSDNLDAGNTEECSDV